MNEDETPKNSPSPDGAIDQAPADALSRTPDDLDDEQHATKIEAATPAPQLKAKKKPSAVRRFFRRINVYLLLFILIVVVAGAVTIVQYLNSQKVPEDPAIASQELSEEELRQLATSDTSVGDTNQSLTIRGNAIIDGQTLMRGNLSVAGNIQAGGSLQAPSLTISGTANLGTAQASSLQVAGDVSLQGNLSATDLSIAGGATFGGPLTASRITVSDLVLSGNSRLEIPNHLSFSGPSPSRAASPAHVGAGGSASVSGSDASGTVNISTGNGPQAGCMVRVTFHRPYASQPRVILSPIGNAAGQTQHYVERDQSGFSICSATPAPSNASFGFDYFIAG